MFILMIYSQNVKTIDMNLNLRLYICIIMMHENYDHHDEASSSPWLSEVTATNVFRRAELVSLEAVTSKSCLDIQHFLLRDRRVPREGHRTLVHPVLHGATVLGY